MKTLFLTLMLLSSTLAFAQDNRLTDDPMAYSREHASYYEGDMGPGDVQECSDETQTASGDAMTISCWGTVRLLMHGGYPVNANYSCTYNFEKIDETTYEDVTPDDVYSCGIY